MIPLREAASRMATECLCFGARRMSRTLTRIYDDALRPLDLTAAQLMLLNAIALSSESGTPMHALADVLSMDRTTLSRNVRPLEKAGLIRVARAPSDARARLVLLTPAGERLMAEAAPIWQAVHDEVTVALGQKRAADLRNRLDAAVVAAGRVRSG